MVSFAADDVVIAEINGQETVGRLVDIDIQNKLFEVKTEHGRFWVSWDKIRHAK